jgi:hypothetical protein
MESAAESHRLSALWGGKAAAQDQTNNHAGSSLVAGGLTLITTDFDAGV